MSYKGLLVSTLISTLAAPAISHAAFWAPHLGIDYKWWGIEPRERYDDIFPHINHAFNFYVGTRINGYFGFDFGWEESERATENHTYLGTDIGETFFAQPQLPFTSTSINMRIRDFHFDLNFYWEVWRNFELIFMGGVAFWHIDSHINHLANDNWVEFINESENKTMGRIGLGFQYNVIPCLGLKFMILSDPGIRINDIGRDQDKRFYDIHPYKTAVAFNLGFVYSFSNPRRHREIEVYDPYDDDP